MDNGAEEDGGLLSLLADIGREAGEAAIRLFSLPYLYIAIALTGLHALYVSRLQRKLFHVRLHSSLMIILTRLGAGIAVGVAMSILSIALGGRLTAATLLAIWIALGIVALFRLRYANITYAAGALGIVQALLGWANATPSRVNWLGLDLSQGFWHTVVSTIHEIDMPSILLIAGVLQIGEGLVVLLQRGRLAVPLNLEGKRGKPMGAFALSGIWAVPLIWLVPAGSGSGFTLAWLPIAGSGEPAAWSFIAFPLLIGFGQRTTARWPEQLARESGYRLMAAGAVIAVLAVGAWNWAPLVWIGSIAAISLHEAITVLNVYRERRLPLAYAHQNQGVRVLAVLPDTPAEEMQVLPGETIQKVNGIRVQHKQEVHAALQKQAAFCKLEVVNREGHVRFAQRAKYAGEHHQLGILFAPDEEADYAASPKGWTIWRVLSATDLELRKHSPRAQMLEAKEAELREVEAASVALSEAAIPEEEAVIEVEPGLPPRSERRT